MNKIWGDFQLLEWCWLTCGMVLSDTLRGTIWYLERYQVRNCFWGLKGLKHLTPFIKLQERGCKTVPSAAIPFRQGVCGRNWKYWMRIFFHCMEYGDL